MTKNVERQRCTCIICRVTTCTLSRNIFAFAPFVIVLRDAYPETINHTIQHAIDWKDKAPYLQGVATKMFFAFLPKGRYRVYVNHMRSDFYSGRG